MSLSKSDTKNTLLKLNINKDVSALVRAAYLLGRKPKLFRVLRLLEAKPMYTRELLAAAGGGKRDYERSATLRALESLAELGVIKRKWVQTRDLVWRKYNYLTPLGKLLLELLSDASPSESDG